VAAVETIARELHAYNPALLSLPRIVAANKIDLPHEAGLAALAARCTAPALPVIAISALTGEGISGLLEAIADRLRAVQGMPHGS
jgi:GTPase involved in cell partitioning and DNA repair